MTPGRRRVGRMIYILTMFMLLLAPGVWAVEIFEETHTCISPGELGCGIPTQPSETWHSFKIYKQKDYCLATMEAAMKAMDKVVHQSYEHYEVTPALWEHYLKAKSRDNVCRENACMEARIKIEQDEERWKQRKEAQIKQWDAAKTQCWRTTP